MAYPKRFNAVLYQTKVTKEMKAKIAKLHDKRLTSMGSVIRDALNFYLDQPEIKAELED